MKLIILALGITIHCFSFQGRRLAQIEDFAPCSEMESATAQRVSKLIQDQAPTFEGLYLLDYFCESCGDSNEVPQMIESIDVVQNKDHYEIYFDGVKVNISNYYLNRHNLALKSQCVDEVVLPTI